ncbi:MAG: hypothetical protein IID45_11210 [Planctomycetes bacterium]|nr:hypothetical protein [Planctomycetota bacterium]
MKQDLRITITEGETVKLDSDIVHLSEMDEITVERVENHSQGGDRPRKRVHLRVVRYGEQHEADDPESPPKPEIVEAPPDEFLGE